MKMRGGGGGIRVKEMPKRVTHIPNVFRAVFSSGVDWDILVLIKVNASVAYTKKVPLEEKHMRLTFGLK